MARSGLRRLAIRLLTVLAGVVLALLLLEGLVRLIGLESASYSSISGFCRHDPHLGWKLIPDHHTVFKGRHFSVPVATSSQGLRDRFYPVKPEPGRRRILVLGDSIAWCWGVRLEECFTKQVEAGLTQTDVITMGLPGYSTAQSLLFYERIGRQFEPDLVLFVSYGNDVVENLDHSKRPGFEVTNGELVLTNYPVARRKSRLKEWLRGHSRLFVQVDHAAQVTQEMLRQWREGWRKERGAGKRDSYAFLEPDREEEAWILLEALLDRFRAGVSADGARFEIVSIDQRESFGERFELFCSTRDCRLLDFDPILRRAEAEDRPVRLEGDPHLSPEGNRLLADAVLEFLARAPLASDAPIR